MVGLVREEGVYGRSRSCVVLWIGIRVSLISLLLLFIFVFLNRIKSNKTNP